ncbi:MAG: acetolactate synthase small subunit [Anaerolineaceae bacterium]|jgi:acetolactate synthase-1/3 small subunit|nr:acetolactate synthase small subunit [Anaerolineaceae bacterium]
MRHTLVALVEDKPGVLNRVASLFRRRAFNIESLTVGHTETPGVSRMTIVVDTDDTNTERLVAYLYKLVNVIQVFDLTKVPSVTRDLAMIKVNASPENRTHVMQVVDVFRARIVDVANNSLIIEITGDEEKIEGFVDVLRPLGIIEMARTGLVTMARGVDAFHPHAVNWKMVQTENVLSN